MFLRLPKRTLLLGIFTACMFCLLLISFNVLLQNEELRDVTSEALSNDRLVHDSKPRLAILVPFRNRFDELIVFVPQLSEFLRTQDIGSFKFYILNQSRRYRFNRGALANVGYLLAKRSSDYIAIHDVDLIPINKDLSYSYPEDGPFHLSSPDYHPQYNYKKYFGGILLINNKQFELINGMSNRYFGWGLEDDDFYARVRAANLPILRPQNLSTDRTNTFLHIHNNQKRDSFKSKEQQDVLRRRDKQTGLSNIRFSINAKHNITIDDHYDCTVYNIELSCNTKETPWCQHNYVRQFANRGPNDEAQ